MEADFLGLDDDTALLSSLTQDTDNVMDVTMDSYAQGGSTSLLSRDVIESDTMELDALVGGIEQSIPIAEGCDGDGDIAKRAAVEAALRLNEQCQAQLRHEIELLRRALERNEQMQQAPSTGIGAKAKTRKVQLSQRRAGRPYFADATGNVPPANSDTDTTRAHRSVADKIMRPRNWTAEESKQLAEGVRNAVKDQLLKAAKTEAAGSMEVYKQKVKEIRSVSIINRTFIS